LLHRRFLLSLVVALSVSNLAAANSAPANTVSPRFATGMNSHLSLNSAKSTPVAVEAFSNHPATGGNLYGMNLYRVNLAGSNSGGVSSPDTVHNNIKFRTAGWTNGSGHGMAAPEPGSLMLLSTGLFGIAGIVRRKLLRS
jgi:hypothetical protein